MTFDASFINVFGDPADGTDAAIFNRLFGSMPTAVSPPRTYWISHSAVINGLYWVPAQSILSFAPGAQLTLKGGTVLQIAGVLDAGWETRFQLIGDARVELTGPLDEIVADWWATTGGISPVERAFQALLLRYTLGLLPAVIQVDGPYALSAPVLLGPAPADGSVIEVVLRGRHLRSLDPPTFSADALSQPVASFLQVAKNVVVALENVAFDATVADASDPSISQKLVRACVAFDDPAEGSRFEACSFRFVDQAIQINSAGVDLTATVPIEEIVRRVVRRPVRLDVLRCVFTGARVSGSYNLETRPDEAPASQGIRVDAGTPVSLSVRDCQFVGVFANAIAILGGDLDVMACQFANEATVVIDYQNANSAVFPTADLLVRRWDDDWLYIEAYPNLKDSGPTVKARLVKQAQVIYSGTPLINTQVTVTHCVSTSPCFLIMGQSFSYADTVLGGAMLSNVRHTPPGLAPTSIVLRTGAPVRALMMQGCWLDGSVRLEDGSGESVVDLGTVFPHSPDILIDFISELTNRRLAVVTL